MKNLNNLFIRINLRILGQSNKILVLTLVLDKHTVKGSLNEFMSLIYVDTYVWKISCKSDVKMLKLLKITLKDYFT